MTGAHPPETTRGELLRFRFRRHQLDRAPSSVSDAGHIHILDHGVQNTGPDGAAWALASRGAAPGLVDDLALAWSLRGAPHAYRRGDLRAVAVATAPLSELDARKRIFDASKPLLAAGIDVLEALRTIAGHLREIVDRPTVKGEVSRRLTERVDEPYLRYCRACEATHVYENPFRLAALQAGLVLEAGTSPPVLRRIPRARPAMYRRSGDEAEPRFDVIRNYLRFYGPARIKDAAEFLDAPVKEVKEHWPDDVTEVRVADAETAGRQQPRYVLSEDVDALAGAGEEPAHEVRMIGPYDPYLQLRDRDLLVADGTRRKVLWPVLGRPGAVVADGEVVATWRPRSSGNRLTVAVEPWVPMAAKLRSRIGEEAERLASHRDVELATVDVKS